ncbi:hypothetical protein PQG46_01920 [Aquirufa nivalisilvae]
MAIIKIDKNIKLEDVESCYNELHGYIDKQLSVDLSLPKILEHNYFGLIPSLYQFAVTWVRYSNSGKLLLDIDNINETDLDKLYENELLFPLISLVWNKNEVYTKDGLTNLRTILRPKNVEMFEKMKKVKSLKGSKLLLTTFDHLPEDRGVLPCFEINHEFIKNEFVLTSNLRPSLTEILNFSIETKSNYELIGKHLMGIVYELMKNTYEWAREDESRVPLDPSVRGLLIRFFKKRRKSLLEDFQKHKGLKEYFESNLLKENRQSELYFLEVSVFDSGIGFIDKFKSLNPTETLSDIDILKKCLIVHNTSAKGLYKDDKGIGLDRILSILDKKGFLRIKTGNLCVYRNLITHNHKELDKEDVNSMELFDWNKNSNTDYTSFKNSKGAVVTIIYPLSINTANE